MMAAGVDAWFAARTAGAPAALRRRAELFFSVTGPSDLATRLSDAGHAALGAAMRGGAERAAALDLLAADALITLALLAGAEADPVSLGRSAAALRVRACAPLDPDRD
jgi:hypothetical protein